MTNNDPFKARYHLDMYPLQLPLHSFPSPVLSLQLGAEHPCFLGRPLLAPSLVLGSASEPAAVPCPTSGPTPGPDQASGPTPCPATGPSSACGFHKHPAARSRSSAPAPLQLQPLRFLQWLLSLLLWLPSSALELQVERCYSPIKNWSLQRLALPLAQTPLSPPASPMLHRGRSPECRRSSTQCPRWPQTETRTRCAFLGPGTLTLKEMEELEQLTQQLMQDMERPQRHSVVVNEPCAGCHQPLALAQPAVHALGQLFHITCFTCHQCEQQLQGQQFYSLEGAP